MSWGEYLQGGSGLMNHYQKIESCGIFGHNGSTWAQVGMDHTQQYYNEITDLVGLFTDPSSGKGFQICCVIISENNDYVRKYRKVMLYLEPLRLKFICRKDSSYSNLKMASLPPLQDPNFSPSPDWAAELI